MKFLEDRLAKIEKAVVVIDPVIQVVHSSGLSLRLKYNNRVSFHGKLVEGIEEWFLTAASEQLRLTLNDTQKKYTVHIDKDDLYSDIANVMLRLTRNFIANHGPSTNNRLTSLYQWFNRGIYAAEICRNESLAADLFNICTLIQQVEKQKDPETIKIVNLLLQAVKNKYST
jgi:hypothetical protein